MWRVTVHRDCVMQCRTWTVVIRGLFNGPTGADRELRAGAPICSVDRRYYGGGRCST